MATTGASISIDALTKMNEAIKQKLARPRRRALRVFEINTGKNKHWIVKPTHYSTLQLLEWIREWKPEWFTEHIDVPAENFGTSEILYPFHLTKSKAIDFLAKVAAAVRGENTELGHELARKGVESIRSGSYLFWYHVEDKEGRIKYHILDNFDIIF